MGPLRMFPIISCLFALVGLAYANGVLLVDIERADWGHAAFEVVMAATNCLTLGLNIGLWLRRRRRPPAWAW